jgi:hypothetical protein
MKIVLAVLLATALLSCGNHAAEKTTSPDTAGDGTALPDDSGGDSWLITDSTTGPDNRSRKGDTETSSPR